VQRYHQRLIELQLMGTIAHDTFIAVIATQSIDATGGITNAGLFMPPSSTPLYLLTMKLPLDKYIYYMYLWRMIFEFDPKKAVANLRRHGVSFAEPVCWTERGQAIRLISARLATQSERKTYES